MKKLRKLLKTNIKTVLAFIIGGIVFGTIGVYAATTLLSQSVYYNNSTSGASSTNVQGALDELYTRANTWIDPSYIDFGTLATNTAKTVLASKNGVCIKRNNKVSCFKANNWAVEKDHIQQVFSDISCDVGSSGVICTASDFFCVGYRYGLVHCSDQSDSSGCNVDSDGSVSCN